jgi:hypothetical protein
MYLQLKPPYSFVSNMESSILTPSQTANPVSCCTLEIIVTRNIFVSLALLAGMASPAFAQDSHTINVWGAQLEAPGVLQRIFEAPRVGIDLPGQSVRWTAGTPFSAQAAHPSVPLYAGDEDGNNAKNPVLPSYERGRGKETGGPKRMQIPD